MMTSKGFHVKIYFDLHVITCPGVWLCPNGDVALQINTLNSHIESRKSSSTFPIIIDDKFLFKKTFIQVCTLNQLQCCLEDEYFYAELIQWPTIGCKGVVLATFETNLVDLLYPASCLKGLAAGVDVDLLMEPTKYFPGILAPKIEVSTRTVIEEVGISDLDIIGAHVINPKLINSKGRACLHRKRPSEGILRQKRVCHSHGRASVAPNRCTHHHTCSDRSTTAVPGGHRAQQNKKYIQLNQRASKPPTNLLACPRASKNSSTTRFHNVDDCPVCLRYKNYFSVDSRGKDTRSKDEIRREATNGVCDVNNCQTHSSSSKKSSLTILQEKIRSLQKDSK